MAPGPVNTTFLEYMIKAGPEKMEECGYEKLLRQKEAGGVSPEKAAKLCLWLASQDAQNISGKILSAVHNPYDKFTDKMKDIMSTDVFTMRRIRLEDRGLDWNM